MKRFLTLLLLVPFSLSAQKKERFSQAYLGAILHDNQPGISLSANYGINKHIGIGAGADVTRFEGEMLVPVYVDAKFRFPVKSWAPYLGVQGGYPLYNKVVSGYTDISGRPLEIKTRGKSFLGTGIGVAYKKGKVGVFASYTRRWYNLKYDEVVVNGRDMNPDKTQTRGVFTTGLIF